MRVNLMSLLPVLAVLTTGGAGDLQTSGLQAVIYYNEACDECVEYIDGSLLGILSDYDANVVRRDYINQPEHRRELNDLNDRLGVPLDLQSHLATYLDGGRIILMGEPPEAVVRELLSRQSSTPPRLLIYRDEGSADGGNYLAWAFAGPVQSYPPDTPIQAYLDWLDANREAFSSSPTARSEILLPAVLFAGLVDGINPCAIAILLFFITFLYSIRKTTASVAKMGAVYIGAVYAVYFLIGLGLLRASTLIQGHWLGVVGAALLILFGLINLLGALFPQFPIRLEVPARSKESLKNWMYRATLPTTLVLGVLVGVHEFPCSGGPYVAVLGLLGSQAGFLEGLVYLALYNLMFVLPLIVVLVLSMDHVLGKRMQAWERSSSRAVRGLTGAVMTVLGVGLLIWML